ncbi:2-keto-4-pentenoate hydratase/2-oxohepta-3-ene-1,7-dioic acid hydratase in catechol pathway [Promicromonospora sp. AC04]|uniref:fumarylacetoacetate hydrolase family protein n=1 Tax=Promicromonospora sp. AC04 TaxID=2135723 RepID=UPI000D334E7A|nr:fumarylacetoacetate hydrolase family protein [Promicromonospora sp. AC04]PUB26270.1 2-keto-4-pentenoate hydratase/2-oxohepta-3-ene-1,7-dioic acid hydratase in catechol pathway [Promicromonospora sp. AC04]
MRLASFLVQGTERWGVVVRDPGVGQRPDAGLGPGVAPGPGPGPGRREWLVEPALAEAALAAHAAIPSSGPATAPRFLAGRWPDTLVGFLALDDAGLVALSRLVAAVERFAAQTDATILPRSGHPVGDRTEGPGDDRAGRPGYDWADGPADSFELLAPIPRPRLCWGLVTNSPSFLRNRPGVPLMNLFPLGHQRPQGAVVGQGAPVVMRHDNHLPSMAYNVELAVVIGRTGRDIPVERAMEHVAGYTVVNDVSGTHYYSAVPGNTGRGYSLPPGYQDWLYQATASWGGKKADTLCPMGPYLVTKDEVGDPYNLLMWTRQSGRTRDRAHTGATLLGIERVIAWYSSFASLHVGDVIHFGTMGVDGLPVTPAEIAAGTRLEVEIESVGALANPVVVPDVGHDAAGSTRTDLTRHSSWAVRELALHERNRPGVTAIEAPEDWSVAGARHFWTSFGNGAPVNTPDPDGLPRLAVPRFLNGPASSLSAGSPVRVPARATDLVIAVELALVVRRLTSDAADVPDQQVARTTRSPDRSETDELVLGYTPLVSVCDQSFRDAVVEPARAGERGIGAMYGRWADGFNVVLPAPQPLAPVDGLPDPDGWSGREMWLRVTGVGTPDAALAGAGAGASTAAGAGASAGADAGLPAEVHGSTAAYAAGPTELLAAISRMITLFPGDVVTLGATSARVRVTREQYAAGLDVTAGIEGLGTVRARITPDGGQETT